VSSFLRSVAAWFKCHAIRYFELDASIANIYQNSVDYHFPDLNNNWNQNYLSYMGDRNSAICNSDDWICQGQPRCNQRDSRHISTKNKAVRRYQFFIGEVRNHYDVVNRQVYGPLSNLGLSHVDNPHEYPSWKSRLKVNGYIHDNFLTDMARHHISNDSPELLGEITDYMKCFRLHTKNVDSLPRIIASMVKSKFIESGIYPTPIDNYKKEGYYHFGDVGHILSVDICEGFLCGDRDVQSFVRNFNFLGHEFSEDERFLRLGSHVIGRGNKQQRDTMRDVLMQIPRNRLILNALNDLMNSKLDLDTRATRIRNMATPLSTSIVNLEYRRLYDCCPTQDSTIWNFG
jgi:hypothetical protein